MEILAQTPQACPREHQYSGTKLWLLTESEGCDKLVLFLEDFLVWSLEIMIFLLDPSQSTKVFDKP